MYQIETVDNKKFVTVGEYTLLLHEDRVEATIDDRLLQVHDYMMPDPTKAEKLEVLTDVISYYHRHIGDAVEPCPFDM